jgi:hypothetical protein
MNAKHDMKHVQIPLIKHIISYEARILKSDWLATRV